MSMKENDIDSEKLGYFQTLKEDDCLTTDNLPNSQCIFIYY
jgi:hypothetical protein